MEYKSEAIDSIDLFMSLTAARIRLFPIEKCPRVGEIVDLGKAGKMEIAHFSYDPTSSSAIVLVQDARFRHDHPDRWIEDHKPLDK